MENHRQTALPTLPLSLSGAFSLCFEKRATLLIFHPNGVETVILQPGHKVILGRSRPASALIAHPSISRQHASFELQSDEVWVKDLDSTNGTRVNGELISHCKIKPDDEVTLGEVTVTLHWSSPAVGQLLGLCNYDRFLTILDEEIIRHRTFQRSLGLLMIRADQHPKKHLRHWSPRIRQQLRLVDRMALYSPNAVIITVPESTAESLRNLAQMLMKGQPKDEPPLFIGAAIFPEAGNSPDEIIERVRKAAHQATQSDPVKVAMHTAKHAISPAKDQPLIVQSQGMKKIFDTIPRLGRATIPVLIYGETGVGKEIVAQAIHDASPRREGPLFCINCGAIPEQLIEGILFGHEKGAFTGADRRAIGAFEAASGGTLFLDEIGELSPSAQASLLRALETKRITRVGGTVECTVDVRLVAATNRNLEAMCEAGAMRWDLLYRINSMTLKIPPLRERPEEIEPFIQLFIEEFNGDCNGCVRQVAPEALDKIRRYPWPGNIRELRNAIHRAVVLAPGDTITCAELPERIVADSARLPEPLTEEDDSGAEEEEMDFKTRIQKFEERLIRRALTVADWNQTEAAQKLKIPLRTLSNKIKAYGLK